ncbi:MAG: fructosamine kinase family protein, partial [Lachnospiraceae bacterium]|nr:fructosamine kinase family protein [Lachnospiraceae bacterium]
MGWMAIESYRSIEEAVKGTFGEDITIEADLKLLSNGKKIFFKFSDIGNPSSLNAEEEGINAIAATNTIAVPKIYAKGTDKERRVSFLMIEFIDRGMETNENLKKMGYEFADMHLADTKDFVKNGKYGFLHNNYIGLSKQINTPKDTWIDFFR